MNKLSGCSRYSIFGFALFLPILFASSAFGQQQVANYATGKVGTKSYEHISFWVRENQIDEIAYSYGKDWYEKEIKLTYLGTDVLKGEPCFKVQFPNNHILYIIPKGISLKIVNGEGHYTKSFRWEYEGPVNGRGTFCDVCAQDEKEAMKLIKKYFMK